MIVDMHVHTLPSCGEDPDHAEKSMEKMLEYGKRLGIDRFTLLGLDYGEAANASLARVARRFPGRVLPFYRGSCIDPASPAALERCVKEYGFYGLKLHEEMPFFPLSGILAAHPLFLKAEQLGVPIVIHSWHQEEGLRDSAPRMLDGATFPASVIGELGRRHPGTRFILAHVGGMWMKAFQAARPWPNVSFDVSGFDPERGIVEKGVEMLGAGRLFFGSDMPGRNAAAQLAKVRHADIGEAEKALILGGNASSLLGLGGCE